MIARAFGLLSLVMLRVRGQWCRFRYGVVGRHEIGKRLLVRKGLIIRGPGRVVIGDFVSCGDRVTIYTDSSDALVEIGSHTFLNGTRFSCGKEVSIGESCILADCRVMDSDYHSLDPDQRELTPEPRPVHIGDRVWLTMGVIVLKGVSIGEGATVTPASVVTSDLESRCLHGGNPAKKIRAVGSTPP